MATDFCLVTHATQRHLYKFAANRFGNAFDNRGFTNAGRASKTKDGAFHVLLHAKNGKVLNDSLLDQFQTVVILFKHAAGTLEIQIILRHLTPGKIKDPFHIGAAYADFRRPGRHAAQTIQLFLRLLTRLVIQRRFGKPLAQFLYIRSLFIAQLRLNRLDLLAKIVILLIFLNLALDACLNLLFNISQLCFTQQDSTQHLKPFLKLYLFQNGLAVFQLG